MNPPLQRNRVLSGARPASHLHLGHYFGAIHELIERQEEDEIFFLIADYHALILEHDERDPQTNLREVSHAAAAAYLACGVDPERSVLYLQSDLPEVCELSWLLSTASPLGTLKHGTVYRYRERTKRSINAGMLNYPILMAADLLLIGATVAAAGRDQFRNLEIVKEIIRRFNFSYGEDSLFIVPEHRESRNPFVVGTNGDRMSITYDNTIGIFDEGEVLRAKIEGIKTDSKGRNEQKDPETCNIYSLYSLMASEKEREQLSSRYHAGISYEDAKVLLFEKTSEYFAPIRERFQALQNDRGRVYDALNRGAEKARVLARQTMNRVRSVAGVSR